MIGAIGFTLIMHGNAEQYKRANSALAAALSHFPNLVQHVIKVGDTRLVLWGRAEVEDYTYRLPDNSLLALIGSPIGTTSWKEIENAFANVEAPEDYRLSWDGRFILLNISADGKRWIMWNDWLGSIPVYRSEVGNSPVISTLEPVVVSFRQFTSQDFFLPGLVAMLAMGNLLGDWTIYKNMKVTPPDAVAQWDERGFHWQACSTVLPTAENWESGWDHLVDEMHHFSKKAIKKVLKAQSSFILPLSSGLDSRLIAAVGAESGCDIRTYTWGPPTTRDVVYADKIARTLNLPWKRVDLGEEYLAEHVKLWSDVFGSSMPFRGMYQIPFFIALGSESPGKILSGFLGGILAGVQVKSQTTFLKPELRRYYTHPPEYSIWEISSMKQLFKIPIDTALEQLADEISGLRDLTSGAWFQKILFLNLWGRQRYFTYFQSFLSDYWLGVEVPYLNREYAQFCLSLPRAVLDDRCLQIDMMCRYYPEVMRIPGTYANQPAITSGSFLLKRKMSNFFPKPLATCLLPEFFASKSIQSDIKCLQVSGEKAIWPIPEVSQALKEWFNIEQITRVYEEAIGGDKKSLRKLQAIQAIAFRLLE
jgi:hypothetical protein